MVDTVLARPPSPTYTAITPVTRAPEQNEPATNTDLPVQNTVRPAVDAQELQQEEERARERERESQTLLELVAPPLDRSNNFDPETESFIYVATDPDSGEVVRQIPSETLRRLRAYAETIAAQQGPAQPQNFQTTV
ncbi:hypothetical protein E1180_10470 [Roseibium denhamense]|uniref:Flagellar protein FlaG n=1 Tax=Roseibium denhamense TaxID=76305 RepID=A0ABY1N892_9HYPH|nr:hypothetical protein [Roseibium denhamense]MTI05935.1 hypothetical protein [Roseibium denhamense]SMP03080.1 flagellar protein FlaG [Roseibium denhamense]